MKRLIDYFRGTIRVRVECGRPERVLNLCAQNGIDMWDVRYGEEDDLQMTLYISGYKKLRELAGREGAFSIETLKRTGAPFFLWRIRKRYVFIAGLALCLFLVWFSSLFIWQIEVSGNEKVPSSKILAELRELGIGIGTCRLQISQEFISNKMLLLIPELSWLTVNTHGSRAEVLVREEREPPEIIDESEPTLVYASKGGIITKMTVTGGRSVVAVGDTVAAGDVLVTGAMESLASGERFVRAEADIVARTWYEYSARMPLGMLVKEYTGEEKTRTALILGGKRVNLYFTGGNPWDNYDKITLYDTLTMPNGAVLPVTTVKEKFAEYVARKTERPLEDAARILKARLLSRLEAEIGGGGIISTDYTVSEEDGVVMVTLYAECEEQIGRERALAEEEKAPAG